MVLGGDRAEEYARRGVVCRDVITCLSDLFEYVPGLVVDLEEMHPWNPRLGLLLGGHVCCLAYRVTR